MNKKKQKNPGNKIALNRKALHDYLIVERLEAGLVLEGWEVKSLRAGRAQLKENFITFKDGNAWVTGIHISPLKNISTHITPDPTRTRKLLLHRREINSLFSSVKQKGFTAIALDLHWHKNRVKIEIALAKGKKLYDKRETLKRKELDREQRRLLKR